MAEDRVLIDTSVWVSVTRRPPPHALLERVAGLLRERLAATTGMVMQEVLAGAKTERRYQEMFEELRVLHYLPTDPAWLQAWRLAVTLRRQGITVPPPDIIIAAVAITHGCRVLHADEHFNVIARHSDLQADAARLT